MVCMSRPKQVRLNGTKYRLWGLILAIPLGLIFLALAYSFYVATRPADERLFSYLDMPYVESDVLYYETVNEASQVAIIAINRDAADGVLSRPIDEINKCSSARHDSCSRWLDASKYQFVTPFSPSDKPQHVQDYIERLRGGGTSCMYSRDHFVTLEDESRVVASDMEHTICINPAEELALYVYYLPPY